MLQLSGDFELKTRVLYASTSYDMSGPVLSTALLSMAYVWSGPSGQTESCIARNQQFMVNESRVSSYSRSQSQHPGL